MLPPGTLSPPISDPSWQFILTLHSTVAIQTSPQVYFWENWNLSCSLTFTGTHLISRRWIYSSSVFSIIPGAVNIKARSFTSGGRENWGGAGPGWGENCNLYNFAHVHIRRQTLNMMECGVHCEIWFCNNRGGREKESVRMSVNRESQGPFVKSCQLCLKYWWILRPTNCKNGLYWPYLGRLWPYFSSLWPQLVANSGPDLVVSLPQIGPDGYVSHNVCTFVLYSWKRERAIWRRWITSCNATLRNIGVIYLLITERRKLQSPADQSTGAGPDPI